MKEIDYNNHIKFASSVIKQRSLEIDPFDVVNSAYIIFSDSHSSYDFTSFNKLILNEIRKDKVVQYGENILPSNSIEDKTCSFCKEVKPKDCFYLAYSKQRNVYYYWPMCKPCQTENNKKNVANFISKNRKRWDEIQKKYMSSEKGIAKNFRKTKEYKQIMSQRILTITKTNPI